MINTFCKSPLWECNATLIKVAQGMEPADTVITNAKLVNVNTAEILENTQIAIACGRVAYVGENASHCIGDMTVVVDAEGSYVAPGLMDGHMHVESAMVGVAEYARAAVPHGTTGIYMDPHECANVCGLDGVAQMMKDAKRAPLKAMLTTPSCVPAVTGFEDTGSFIDAKDVENTMGWESCVGLGEMMNYPGILAAVPATLDEVSATLKAGKTVTGHYSVPETDRGLNAYVAAGISACHESVRAEDVIAKMRLGMYAQLREGSAWLNLQNLAPAITEHKVDTRFCNLVTDDCHPNTLLSEGHVDRLLRRAVECGIDPVVAIQMVTINCATCFGQQQDLGSIAPGKCADIVFFDDLKDFNVTRVYIDGDLVAKDGEALFEPNDPFPFHWPAFMTNTMNVGRPIDDETFKIPAVDKAGDVILGDTATVRVMRCASGDTITHEEHLPVPIVDGCLEVDKDNDVIKAFVFERHAATGTHGAGFVQGFGIHGALAQTVAHDAHNLLVIGDNDHDMAVAANTLIACGGGEVSVVDGEVKALVELPICGLMSDKHVTEVAAQVAKAEEAWKEMGCKMASPFMTLGLLSLACIPELRLTNRGHVDCNKFEFVGLVVEDGE